jgi:ATP-dependent DNA helicase RecG
MSMRPEILFPLFKEASLLKGVGPAVARQLERLEIARVLDVLFHLPSGVIRRQWLEDLSAVKPDMMVVLKVFVVDHQLPHTPRQPIRILTVDCKGVPLTLSYFSNPSNYVQKLLPRETHRIVSGKLDQFNEEWQMVHPDYVVRPEQSGTIPLDEPVYPLTEGLSNKRMRTLMDLALEYVPELPEWIDAPLKAQRLWPGWLAAVRAVHHKGEDREASRKRLAYDELFTNQLALALLRKRARSQKSRALLGDVKSHHVALPFTLTTAQLRCITEIVADMSTTEPMLRLLQGDVGSGKTVVALLAAARAAESGVQSAILAPTEILARQHLATFEAIGAAAGLRVVLLTGRDKGKARELILQRIARGEVDVVIGTHALFQEDVVYHDLGFVVIDEQHKFGVHQRLLLTRKAEIPPHMLVMTATPIPRTLTLTAYGELDISLLNERPPGRLPVDTRVLPLDRLEDVYAGISRQMKAGAQIYWVCPLVEESEKVDLAAAQARAAHLRERFGDDVALVHGKLKPAEKDAAMQRFKDNGAKILVATTVIEVGVDVPNATVMVIEQAERFGLAQLHQLRGRVGRGSGKSVCLLLRGVNISDTARDRLSVMRDTDDGFVIAEEDLRLRGGGELLGTRQSGLPEFKLADLMLDGDILPVARDDARLLVQQDEELQSPRGEAARIALFLFERDAAAELLRSG